VGSVCLALGVLLHYQYARSYHFVLSQVASPFVPVQFNPHTVALGNGAYLAQDLLIGPGGPAKLAVTVAVLAIVLLALMRLWRQPTGGERRGGELALTLVLPAILAVALLILAMIPVQGRYLLPLWLPLAIAIGCGLGSKRAGRVGLVATGSLCALWLVVSTISVMVPRLNGREDTRAAAQSLGPASAARLIAINQPWDVLPLRIYRPDAQIYNGGSALVTEIDLVSMPIRGFPADTDANRPPAPHISGMPTGLVLRQVIHGGTYVIERYTSRIPVSVQLNPSARLFSSSWRFLYEPSGAGAREL
jgi:hypothetical protein